MQRHASAAAGAWKSVRIESFCSQQIKLGSLISMPVWSAAPAPGIALSPLSVSMRGSVARQGSLPSGFVNENFIVSIRNVVDTVLQSG